MSVSVTPKTYSLNEYSHLLSVSENIHLVNTSLNQACSVAPMVAKKVSNIWSDKVLVHLTYRFHQANLEKHFSNVRAWSLQAATLNIGEARFPSRKHERVYRHVKTGLGLFICLG